MMFAEKMQQLREKAGLTQASLATAAGISLGAVRDYEQGKRAPSLRFAVKMARALGVTCEAFADCEDVDGEKPKRRKSAK